MGFTGWLDPLTDLQTYTRGASKPGAKDHASDPCCNWSHSSELASGLLSHRKWIQVRRGRDRRLHKAP